MLYYEVRIFILKFHYSIFHLCFVLLAKIVSDRDIFLSTHPFSLVEFLLDLEFDTQLKLMLISRSKNIYLHLWNNKNIQDIERTWDRSISRQISPVKLCLIYVWALPFVEGSGSRHGRNFSRAVLSPALCPKMPSRGPSEIYGTGRSLRPLTFRPPDDHFPTFVFYGRNTKA